MPEPIGEEDFEKKWVTSYQPPGGVLQNVTGVESATGQKPGPDNSLTKGTDSNLKVGSEIRKSIMRQTSVNKSAEAKLDEKMRHRSSDSYGKRTSFYVPPTPAKEQDASKNLSVDQSQRLSSLAEVSKTLLQPVEMNGRQSIRFIKIINNRGQNMKLSK